MTGSPSRTEFVPYTEAFGQDFDDMARRVSDVSKIRQVIGFRPTVHLEEIIARTIPFWGPEGVGLAVAEGNPVDRADHAEVLAKTA